MRAKRRLRGRRRSDDNMERVLMNEIRGAVGENAMKRQTVRRREKRRERGRGRRRGSDLVDDLNDHKVVTPLFQMVKLLLHTDCFLNLRKIHVSTATTRDPQLM